uniref:Derlin n=1 Tax=Bicosoecida sp. CB-2014 TaxID=1486930 RepID=A0A7S1G7K1_9STRA|mmetsp:Transcript_19326/g.68326  ORF Transcript_19326/g.68326 Transcript_19326/m.68326 type:complete len:261 (+) Transcript_19326:226-1008(+)
MPGGGSPQEWFYALPPITRGYLVLGLLTTISFKLGFVAVDSLFFAWPLTWKNFEIWRLFTNFIFFGDFSFNFLISLYMLVRYSQALESNPFPADGGAREGTLADYVWFLASTAGIMCLLNIVFGTYDPPKMSMMGPMYSRWPAMASAMVFTILYTWSKRNVDAQVSFFGFRFQGFYLPWVLLIFHVLIGASIEMDLMGIAVGHLYYFVQVELPYTSTVFQGKRLLYTPQWLTNALDQPPAGAAPPPPRAFVGGGRPLGRE